MNKADICDIRVILFCTLALAIIAGLLIWEDGDRAIEELREWFAIRGGFFAVVVILFGILALAKKHGDLKRKRVEAEREARKTSWPQDYVRDFLEDAIPTGLVPCLSGVDIDEAVERAIQTAGRTYDPEKVWEGIFKDTFFLLDLEPKTIVWIDLECNPVPVYSEWFEELAEISRGSFEPSNVVESWETKEGPIQVEFELGDKKYSVNPKYKGDWLDLGVLHSLNDIIRSSGYQFEVPVREDQTARMLCLNSGQKEVLDKRGWVFLESL